MRHVPAGIHVLAFGRGGSGGRLSPSLCLCVFEAGLSRLRVEGYPVRVIALPRRRAGFVPDCSPLTRG